MKLALIMMFTLSLSAFAKIDCERFMNGTDEPCNETCRLNKLAYCGGDLSGRENNPKLDESSRRKPTSRQQSKSATQQ